MLRESGWELNPRAVSRKSTALPQRHHATRGGIMAAFAVGLFYDNVGNEIGVEMAIGEANRLNVAAAAAAAKAVKDEDEARLRAEQDEQRWAERDEPAASGAEGEPQEFAQPSDEAKGIVLLLCYYYCYYYYYYL